MKKLSIYLMLAVAGLFMAACGQEDNEFAGLTVVTPEEGIVIPGFSAISEGAVDLATFADEDLVTLFTLTGEALPEGYSIENVRIYINPVDDPSNVSKFETNGVFTKAELQDYVTSIYGRRPEARTFEGHVYASVVDANGTGALVDAGVITLVITPEAPVIAEHYYLVGGPMDWAASCASKEQVFSHSNADVYDDPVFTYLLSCAGETWFAIGDDEACDAVANDGNWSLLFGTELGNGKNGMSGTFNRRTHLSDDGSFMLPAGTYLIKLNLMDYTYEISPVASAFYMVGAIPGWNADAAATAMFFPLGDNKYAYTAYFAEGNNLKIWGEDDLGNWDVAYGAVEDNSTAQSGSLVNSGAGAIMVPAAGYWTLVLDFNAMAYAWQPASDGMNYNTVGLIGSFNGWGSQENMTQVAPHNWYIQYAIESDNTELKFRANDDWSYNWGYGANTGDWTVSTADFAKVCSNGAGNIVLNAGLYNFYLNDITGETIIKMVE